MELSQSQVDEYNERGFLILPGLINAEELEVLRGDLARLSNGELEGITREKSGAVRTVFRVHAAASPTYLPSFSALARVPRILNPVQQLLHDDAVYVYHSKCNLKEAIDGEIWQWHQDYGYWETDGVQSPDAMTTVLLILSEATEIGGCLYFIPGSHKEGHVKPTLDETTTSYKLWTVPKTDAVDIMRRYGDPVPIVGKPGSVVLFHPQIVHGSGHNMSRYSRWHIYTVYNRVKNKPGRVAKPRPEWQVSRDYAPLEAAPDGAILAAAGTAVS